MKIKRITKVHLEQEQQYYDVIEANPNHNFLIKTKDEHSIISHNCNFTDEINFSLTSNVIKAKEKAKKMITQIDARQRSRFLRGEYLPTINIIASSKDSEQSFLEEYIQQKEKDESKTTLIVDEPQWVVDSRKDSPKKFWVAIGTKFLPNELLPLDASEELVDLYKAKGYTDMRQVPWGYLETFQQNLDEAICSIIGVATASTLKFIAGERWQNLKTDRYKNPFTREVIEVGVGTPEKPDPYQYSQFFDLKEVSPEDKAQPLFIHLDMSTGAGGKGDKTGIAGVWIVGKQPKIQDLEPEATAFDGGETFQNRVSHTTNELQYKLAFHVSIKAPKGSAISFEKHRAFIRWLRAQGFNIQGVTADQFQSAPVLQSLSAEGFKNVYKQSVDEVDRKLKQCLPYTFFKSVINDGQLMIYKKCDLLTQEIVGLEREADGHINHPLNGKIGCFTGDTLVSLTDGRKLSFLDLIDEQNQGKQNYVYSMNLQTKEIESKPIKKVWLTHKNQPLVKLTLDDGSEIKCTLNHRFMLRNGSYIEAQDLIPGDSLMPLYTKYPDEGSLTAYRMIYSPFEDKWHYEHRWFAREVLDERKLVHHKDCNKNNNNENNLIWCSKAQHIKIHQQYKNATEALSKANAKSKMLKKLFPKIDYGKFKELFGFSYDSLENNKKAPWVNRYRNALYNLINHAIAKVEFISERADVYDLEVPDNHNFALGCGIFVHNSKDCSDAVCGAIYCASKYADKYELDFGQKNAFELTMQTNFDGEVDEIQQLTLNLEEELKRLGPSLNSKGNQITTHPSNLNNATENYSMYGYDDIIIL